MTKKKLYSVGVFEECGGYIGVRATSPPAASQGHSKPTDEELIDRMLHWRSRLGIAFETEDALAKLVASLFIGVIQGNITLAQGDDEIPF